MRSTSRESRCIPKHPRRKLRTPCFLCYQSLSKPVSSRHGDFSTKRPHKHLRCHLQRSPRSSSAPSLGTRSSSYATNAYVAPTKPCLDQARAWLAPPIMRLSPWGSTALVSGSFLPMEGVVNPRRDGVKGMGCPLVCLCLLLLTPATYTSASRLRQSRRSRT
jgi:hypothetical protein